MVRARKYRDGQRPEESKMVCRVCLGDHPLRFCSQFLDINLEERLHLVALYKHCSGCLSHDHNWRTCDSQGRCKHCGDAHHSLLCDQEEERRQKQKERRVRFRGPSSSQTILPRGPRSSQGNNQRGPRSSRDRSARGPRSSRELSNRGPSSSQRESSVAPLSMALVRRGPRPSHRALTKGPRSPKRKGTKLSGSVVPRSHKIVERRDVEPSPVDVEILPVGDAILLRPTAVVKVVGDDRYYYERALMDPSAGWSTISENLVKRLGLKTFRVGDLWQCDLHLRGRYGNTTQIRVRPIVKRSHVVMTPSRSLDSRILEDFPGFQLSDSHFFEAGPVELTLGGDVYWNSVRKGLIGATSGRPVAVFSIFGYLISGVCPM